VLTRFEAQINEQTRQATKAALAGEVWQQRWSSGAQLSFEQIVDLALG
jgi:hypothetical protein